MVGHSSNKNKIGSRNTPVGPVMFHGKKTKHGVCPEALLDFPPKKRRVFPNLVCLSPDYTAREGSSKCLFSCQTKASPQVLLILGFVELKSPTSSQHGWCTVAC